MEQTEADFREIERAHELPPDELYPEHADDHEECSECGSENLHYVHDTSGSLVAVECGDCGYEMEP
jgi:hypothetical protein